MEEVIEQNASVKVSPMTNLRILKETRVALKRISDEVNNKDFGDKVSNDHILIEALKLLEKNKKVIASLKLRNMSADDEEKYTYMIYQEKSGAISWDEFKRKLRRGELSKLMKSLGFEV